MSSESSIEAGPQPSIPISPDFHLSPIRQGDQDAYVHHLTDPTIAKNLLLLPYPYTIDNANWWIRHRESNAKNPETYFAIRRNSDGYLIGAIGTDFDINDKSKHSAEFGYWLSKEYRGQGLMPLSIRAFAKHCFDRLGVHRLQAGIFSYNDASGRALTKAGFVREGLLRHYYCKQGEYIDAISYSLLASDMKMKMKSEDENENEK